MIEAKILAHLLFNEEYSRKILPFLKPEYFQQTKPVQTVFELIHSYYTSYNKQPTKEALYIDLEKLDFNADLEKKECQAVINSLEADHNTSIEWLTDQTEAFCKKKAMYNAILESIQIFDGKSNKTEDAITDIMKNAMAVSFDTHVGHDFLDDADMRYEYYTRREQHIPFDLDFLNKITNGGLLRKTLNVILAGTGTGKSLTMCHMAAANLVQGRNVLYITMEMAEEKIAERIDANLLDIPIQELREISKTDFTGRIDKLRSRVAQGKLIVKEFPTATAGPAQFRNLVNELRLKRNFEPDVIYVDYINICISSRLKGNQSAGSYAYIKAIAEELRGLAGELNLPIVTATQTNRQGMNNSDLDLTNVSESTGLSYTADLFFALISSEELDALGQIQVKQLKNRYADMAMYRRFVLGINRSKMRLYDVDQPYIADTPVIDSGDISRLEEQFRTKKNFEDVF